MEDEYFDSNHPLVGKSVEYDGDTRTAKLGGKIGKIHSVKTTRLGSQTWAVEFPSGQKEYGASWAWKLVEPIAEPGPYDGPHGAAIEAIDTELRSMTQRIAELEAAKKVLQSL